MAIIKRVVGQITLSRIVDVASTTYFYLLMPSAAAVPAKPTTNPPPTYETEGYSGWTDTEPGYTSGDTRSLYVTIRTIYGDGSFEYSAPSLSSSYEAAKQAYNRAQSAMTLAGDMNQYFWEIPELYSTDVPAGAYITEIAQRLFKPNPSGGNIVVQNTGITIRDGTTQLSSLTGSGLNFYDPNPVAGGNNLILSINNGGILQSGNYDYRTDLAEKRFSVSGTKIDLTNGDIITPNFRLASTTTQDYEAGAYIRGTLEALSGYIQKMYIGTNTTNRWEIGNFTNYDQSASAALISNGTAFIQLGKQNTWRLSTDRIHTSWIGNNSSALNFPIYDNKYWDWGIHSPHKTNNVWKDKFLYIRNADYDSENPQASVLAQDLDDDMGLWSYQFWIDRTGNVHAPGFYIGNSTTPIGGGANTIAQKIINSDGTTYGKGSLTKPIYIDSSGYVQEISYTIGQSVPSDSIWIKSVSTTGNGNAVTSVSFNSSTGAVTATKGTTFLTSYTETDPTVPEWAKASTKPSYSYSEINGTVPQSALPSYVDDVLEYNEQSSFPNMGETGKIYVDTSTNKTYRWGGTSYVEISSSLALGETSSTAYRGDRGKTAYDHASAKGSAFTSGLYKITTNSEGHVTAATAASKSDINLGNVENKSSATIRGEITSDNVTSALGYIPYDAEENANGYITSADVSDTHVNVSTRGSTKAYILATTSSPTSTKTAQEAVAETGVYLETSSSVTRMVAPTFVGNLTGTASGNLTSSSTLNWNNVTQNRPTTLSGYGITDAKIASGIITLGNNTITPLTSQWTANLITGASATAKSNAEATTNVYLNLVENNTVRNSHQITGGGTVSVASDSSGKITITGSAHPTSLPNPKNLKITVYNSTSTTASSSTTTYCGGENTDTTVSVAGVNAVTNISSNTAGKLILTKADGSQSDPITVKITATTSDTAASADKLNLNNDAGSTSIPVYFPAESGLPTAVTSIAYSLLPTGTSSSTVAIGNHSHGNITNGGDITANAPTIASGDQIIINDHSASKITNGPTFDGSTTTTALTPKGTWESFSKFSGSYSDLSNKPTIPTITLNGSSTTSASFYAPTGVGSSGQYLKSNGSGAPTWTSFPTIPTITLNGSSTTSPSFYAPTSAGTEDYILASNGSGAPKWIAQSSITSGNTDEKMKWTASTNSNTYYPLVSTSTATTSTANTLNSITFYQHYDTGGGYRRLVLGNTTTYTSTGGAYGTIRLYGTGATYYGDLNPGTIGTNSLTSNRTWTLPNKTGTIALTSDIPDVSSFITDAGVTKITTTAGAHTAITNATGAVSFNVPTTASHVGIKFGYNTSGNNRAVSQDSNGNLYVVQKDDNTNYYHTTGSWGGTNNLTYTATANGGAGALAFTLPTASTSAYGATKLTDTYTSTDSTLAVTGKAIASAISGASGTYVTLNTNQTLTTAGTKTYLGLQTYGTNGIAFGTTSGSAVTSKVTTKYDSTLDALVFSFI